MPYRTTVATPVFGLRREIDRLFDDVLGSEGWGRGGAAWTPAVDVREDARELTLVIELPGVAPADVEVTAENGVLTIRGEKRETRKEGDESTRYHLIERAYGAFSRSFQLPTGLDDSKIEADYANGVMTIHVPKAALPQPRRITINTQAAEAARQG